MYPHERSLVERYQGKPFALLGVEVGSDSEQYKKAVAAKKITWPAWWDEGKIAEAWGVSMFPSVFLIDHKGILRARFTGPPPPGVEATIDKLIREAEKDK